MSITDNLFGTHVANLQSALSRTSQRHTLLTSNLANVNTPGYKRKDIDFGSLLKEEMTPSKQRAQAIRDEQTQAASDRTSLRQDGNNVDMEREVMSMAETEVRYQALTDMTSRYFSELKSAIREGK